MSGIGLVGGGILYTEVFLAGMQTRSVVHHVKFQVGFRWSDAFPDDGTQTRSRRAPPQIWRKFWERGRGPKMHPAESAQIPGTRRVTDVHIM